MNIMELHNFLKDKLIDFLPIVDFRYAVNTCVLGSKSSVQTKEIGREKWDRLSKIVKNPTSRFIYPYRTVLFRSTGAVPVAALFSFHNPETIRLASEEVVQRKYSKPTKKNNSKRFPKISKYSSTTMVSKHFESPNDNVASTPVSLIGKDALDEMHTPIGMFDAPIAEHIKYLFKNSSKQLGFLREVHHTNLQNMSLADVILPAMPGSYKAKEPVDGYEEHLLNEFMSGLIKYNEIFEEGNYGIKELARAGYSAVKRLANLIKLNLTSVEDAEKEELMYTIAPFYVHTDWSGIEKFPTDRDLRAVLLDMSFSSLYKDGRDLLKFKDTMLPIRSRATGNFNMRSFQFDLNVILNRTFCKTPVEEERSTNRRDRYIALFPTPCSDSDRFSLPAMYSIKTALYLYTLQLANIYYTVRMPELREEIKKLDKDTKNAINRLLYDAILEIFSNFMSTHRFFVTLLSYVYLKYSDTSDEFRELLDQLSKLYAVIYCARVRLMKYTLALTVSGNALASASVGASDTFTNIITESYRTFAIGVLHSESNIESDAYNIGAIWDECIASAIAKRKNIGGEG